MIHNKNFQLVC